MTDLLSNNLHRRIAAYIDEHSLCDRGGSVLVGFSGGADSTALLLILLNLGYRVTAVHLQHGLRGDDADRDAVWCAKFAQQRNIQFEQHCLKVPLRQQRRESVEMAARRCRLEFWQTRTEANDIVALGHHADDALEDLLLRLVRGANSSGLTGLRAKRRLGAVTFIRPLLGLRRIEITSYLEREGVQNWCEDSSNQDLQFRRNLVRHRWLPQIRDEIGNDEGVCRTLEALSADADFLEREAEVALPALQTPADWRALHPALLPRALRLWLRQQSGLDMVVGHNALRRLTQELQRQPRQPVDIPLLGGLTLTLSRDCLRLQQKHQPLSVRQWHWQKNPQLELIEINCCLQAVLDADCCTCMDSASESFAAAALPEVLTVRAWQPGDRIIPFGGRSSKKVQDVFSNAKIPREEREQIPVVVAGDTIIWLAGVRRAEFGRVKCREKERLVCLHQCPL